MVSSTAPRLGARCPPVFETTSTTYWRSSEASCSSSCWLNRFKSEGELTSGRMAAASCRTTLADRALSCWPPRAAGTLILSVRASDIALLALGSVAWSLGSHRLCGHTAGNHRSRCRSGQERTRFTLRTEAWLEIAPLCAAPAPAPAEPSETSRRGPATRFAARWAARGDRQGWTREQRVRT